jgi:hypothetical protein
MWLWIIGILMAYLGTLVFIFALCNAAKMGRSDRPCTESDVNPLGEPEAATTGGTASEPPQTAPEPTEAVRVAR